MIDDKKLIEDVYKSMENNPHKDAKVRANHNYEHKHFIDLINRQSQISAWIPVSERLPDNYKEVLVQWEMINRVQNTVIVYISVGLIDEHGEWVNSDVMRLFNGRIIAWQPLPEPYKAGEHE